MYQKKIIELSLLERRKTFYTKKKNTKVYLCMYFKDAKNVYYLFTKYVN